MRSLIRQFDLKSWPISTGPIVVFVNDKKTMHHFVRTSAGNRDGPLIFHMRDGPPNVTGPPSGAGPPKFSSGSGPPQTTGPPMDWLVRKKNLKEVLKI